MQRGAPDSWRNIGWRSWRRPRSHECVGGGLVAVPGYGKGQRAPALISRAHEAVTRRRLGAAKSSAAGDSIGECHQREITKLRRTGGADALSALVVVCEKQLAEFMVSELTRILRHSMP